MTDNFRYFDNLRKFQESVREPAAEQDRPEPRLNLMSSDVYLDSLEYEDSALDEMEAQQ